MKDSLKNNIFIHMLEKGSLEVGIGISFNEMEKYLKDEKGISIPKGLSFSVKKWFMENFQRFEIINDGKDVVYRVDTLGSNYQESLFDTILGH